MTLTRVVSSLAIGVLAVANYLCLFIYGFGLQVRSWWWVIGCAVFMRIVLQATSNKLEKEAEK